MRYPRLRGVAVAALALALATAAPGAFGARERLDLRHVILDLPGPPSKIIPVDLDRDGRRDLVVVVAYTEIEELGEDHLENLIQISRVIPTLFDRREARAYLATTSGEYELAGAPLPLPPSVLHLEAGPPSLGLVALTDDGLAWMRFEPDADGPVFRLVPLIEDPPVLAGSGSFFAELELVHDLDGDGIADVLLPSPGGLAVYLGTRTGISTEPAEHLDPGNEKRHGKQASRWYPFPEVREINGDGLPDLVFTRSLRSDQLRPVHVYLGAGEGRFRPLRQEPLDCHDRGTDLRRTTDPAGWPWPKNLAALRDLDGDGRAEVVTSEQQPRGDSMRKGLKDAKRPIHLYRFYDLGDDLSVEREPYLEMTALGHAMEGNLSDVDDDELGDLPFGMQQFVDLDGDGREDMITVTLEFSIFQVIKILATKRIGIGLNFHVYAQNADGSFSAVPDLDLSEKLKIDLNNLEIGRFAQFAGDFDGDGRHDFVHLGRGKVITIHRGQPGCRYPKDPDLSIKLAEEPAGLDLVRIEDLDGDGRSDIRITRPLSSDDPDVTAPVRLDLYLSGGGA